MSGEDTFIRKKRIPESEAALCFGRGRWQSLPGIRFKGLIPCLTFFVNLDTLNLVSFLRYELRFVAKKNKMERGTDARKRFRTVRQPKHKSQLDGSVL